MPYSEKKVTVMAIVNNSWVCNGPNENLLLNRVIPTKKTYKHFSLSLMIYTVSNNSIKEIIVNIFYL